MNILKNPDGSLDWSAVVLVSALVLTIGGLAINFLKPFG